MLLVILLWVFLITESGKETDYRRNRCKFISNITTLSGADQTFISTVLNENIITDTVTIFRGFLDDNSALIADIFFTL